MSIAKRVSEDRACFRSHRAHSAGSFALALEISRRRWGDGGVHASGLFLFGRDGEGALCA
jgi:hypothetical protein